MVYLMKVKQGYLNECVIELFQRRRETKSPSQRQEYAMGKKFVEDYQKAIVEKSVVPHIDAILLNPRWDVIGSTMGLRTNLHENVLLILFLVS